MSREAGLAYRAVEAAGALTGAAVAPLFGAMSWLRGGRAFHPEGTCFWASVTPIAHALDVRRAAERLGRRALVRLSPGLWRGVHERVEALGCAVRFTEGRDEEARPGDQDLLTATIWRPATLLLSPFFTNAHDYLANVYHAALPFEVEDVGFAFLRLVPARGASPEGGDRELRLEHAFAAGRAALGLELRRADETTWDHVCLIDLREHALVDQERLRFLPQNAGRGLVPRGFVNAMRAPSYRLSQWLRPARGRRDRDATERATARRAA